MSKRLLAVLLTVALVIGIAGGAVAQEQNSAAQEMMEMIDLGNSNFYASGVITSPDQEMWFSCLPYYMYDNNVGLYDPTGKLKLEAGADNTQATPQYPDKFPEGYTCYEIWATGQTFILTVTYNSEEPFEPIPFQVFVAPGPWSIPNLPELPEV